MDNRRIRACLQTTCKNEATGNQQAAPTENQKIIPRKYVHQAKSCAFCGGAIFWPDSEFNMVSMDHKVAMCSHCIDRAAVARNASAIYKVLKGEMGWGLLSQRMEKAVLSCPGGVRMRRTAVKVAMGLALRSSHVLIGKDVGRKCFAVRTADPDTFVEHLETAAGEAGIVVVSSPPGAYEKGIAWRRLFRLYGEDAFMARHGAIVVNGYGKPTEHHALVLIADHPQALDADGSDLVELS